MRGFYKPYMTVDARSRIPTGVFSFISHSHSKNILCSRLIDKRCYVKTKRNITIMVKIEFSSVEPYFSMVIYALEIQRDLFVSIITTYCECLAIPAFATHCLSDSTSSYIIFRKWPYMFTCSRRSISLHTPVMG